MKGPIQPLQRNAGSRPSSDDSPASETSSSLARVADLNRSAMKKTPTFLVRLIALAILHFAVLATLDFTVIMSAWSDWPTSVAQPLIALRAVWGWPNVQSPNVPFWIFWCLRSLLWALLLFAVIGGAKILSGKNEKKAPEPTSGTHL